MNFIVKISGALLLSATFLSANDFSWYEYKSKNIKKEKDTKNYIKSRYGISPKKKSIKSLKEEANAKDLNIGLQYRKGYQYYTDKERTDIEEGTSLGFFLKGKLTFEALGFPLENSYTTAKLFSEQVMASYDYRILNKDRLYIDLSAGLDIATGDSDDAFKTYFAVGVGFNFDDWGIMFEKAFLDKDNYVTGEDKTNKENSLLIYKRF
jgi:hypothetical protein